MLLEVKKLITAFDTERGLLRAVDDISFDLEKGRTLGIVGESGCGKSVTAMSIARLLPQPSGRIIQGEILFQDFDLTKTPVAQLRKLRGNDIGVIFQEPMTALNPCHTIGAQISEVFRLHTKLSRRDAWHAAIEMLQLVRIPAPELRASDYPHQLSGGMRQRVVIALALALRPQLIIADEPTTALDVTVQAQILELIKSIQTEHGSSMILITHDLGVIAETCDDVIVMYAGRIVERAPVHQLFANPRHAYTKGLLHSMPRLDTPHKSRLPVIPGMVSALHEMATGCRYCQRLKRDGPTLQTRPAYREITPGHWLETCPLCSE